MDNRERDKGFADAFYASPAWKRCARGYRRSVGGLCERCRKRGLIVPAVEVHHKIKLSPENLNDPDVTLNWDNLEALCGKCHKEEHRPKRERRWSVAEDGTVTC